MAHDPSTPSSGLRNTHALPPLTIAGDAHDGSPASSGHHREHHGEHRHGEARHSPHGAATPSLHRGAVRESPHSRSQSRKPSAERGALSRSHSREPLQRSNTRQPTTKSSKSTPPTPAEQPTQQRRHHKTKTGDPLRLKEADPETERLMQDSNISHILDLYEVSDVVDAATVAAQNKAMLIRRICVGITRSEKFEYLISLVIMIDFIFIAWETDSYDSFPDFFDATALSFLVIFSLELVIRVIAVPEDSFKTVNLVDSSLVLISAIDVASRVDSLGFDLKLGFLKAFRVVRLVRIVRLTKTMQRLAPLFLLSEAVADSLQPLFFIGVAVFMLICAFAVMMTLLVPDVIAEEDPDSELRWRLTEEFGSIPKAGFTLLLAMTGSPEWGLETGILLLNKNTGSTLTLLVASIIAAFMLFLALSGLTTGVFLEQLFEASKRFDMRYKDRHLWEYHKHLERLNDIFREAGYTGEEIISQREMEHVLGDPAQVSVLTNLGLDMEDARHLFVLLDDKGLGGVLVEEFIFDIFKLKAISGSVDRLTVDYQQEKAMSHIRDLRDKLRNNLGEMQRHFTEVDNILQSIGQEVFETNKVVDRVEELEALIMEVRRRRRKPVQADGTSSPDAPMRVVDLSANLDLNRRLRKLENMVEALRASPEQGDQADDPVVVDVMARQIIASVKRTLEEEIKAAELPS